MQSDACIARRETSKELMWAFPKVYDQILACYAIGLGLPEDFFAKA
jgi:hypothetical protein